MARANPAQSDTLVATTKAALVHTPGDTACKLPLTSPPPQVNALQAELHDLTPTDQLAALVERRGHRDSPYRAQLGPMTQIREDFEQMARLLPDSARQQAAGPDLDAAGDPLPRIDRIVVYIDDLDRCPPDRVVQVLEAVQLLLAVPLFVVVVAVDPRWLLRSLTVHYRELCETARTPSCQPGGQLGVHSHAVPGEDLPDSVHPAAGRPHRLHHHGRRPHRHRLSP